MNEIMATEFFIVFENPAWYRQNRTVVNDFIHTMETFRKNINDQEYWLRGNESGGNWAYGARIFMRLQDMLLEVSSHTPSIVDDIKKLNRQLSDETKIKFVDDDGNKIEYYS